MILIPNALLLSRLDGLQQKLERQGLKNVVYMVVNHQGEQSRHLHPLLEVKLSKNIILYKQDGQQPDVWQTLAGEKDDFFIYDRFDMKWKIQLHFSGKTNRTL